MAFWQFHNRHADVNNLSRGHLSAVKLFGFEVPDSFLFATERQHSGGDNEPFLC